MTENVQEKYLDCCAEDQGHSEGSKFQLMFVPVISSELQNVCIQTWYVDASLKPECQGCYFHGRVHSEGSCYLYYFFLLYIWQEHMMLTRDMVIGQKQIVMMTKQMVISQRQSVMLTKDIELYLIEADYDADQRNGYFV